MNRFKNYVLMAVGFAVSATVVGVFSAGPAIAQAVRAALVANVDDPGRVPYQFHPVCNQISPGGLLTCRPLPPVPPGKRLVITSVSVLVQTSQADGTSAYPVLASTQCCVGMVFPTTFQRSSAGTNVFVFNHQTLIFFDAGSSPNPFFVGVDGFVSDEINLSGYMLDCSTGPCAAIAP